MARSAAPESIGFDEARERVLAAVRPLASIEAPAGECRGRALREPVVAPHGLPPFRNSSMDGYAVRAADTSTASSATPVVLPAVAVIAAGHVAARPLAPGQAMRIMTGAMLPDGADAVVPVEDVERQHLDTPNERVMIGAPLAPGQNVREPGRDLAAGEAALERGRELSAYDLALVASLGITKLAVGPRPRAVVLSTGDELIEPGEPLRPGAIRDSNRMMLAMLLEEAGCTVIRTARIGDRPDAVGAAVQSALSVADVTLTIGGVSAGDFDPVRQALDGLGGIALWRVAMKPGRPQAFGAPGGRLYFGLPGNPASVACTFEALVRPALRKLQGYAGIERPRVAVLAAQAIESRPGRVDFVRVTLERRAGAWWANPAGEQVSGHLVPQSRAHALLVVPAGAPALAAGDAAEAIVLRWPDERGA